MSRKIKAGYIDIDGSSNGQVLTSNGTVVYWANATGSASVNVDAQYVWTNTQTFSNTITFSQTINGTANNALYLGGNSASDLRTYTDNKAGNAYSNAIAYSGNAAAAYANAIVFASNASNINTGTLAEARLPYRMDQNVRTTDNPTFANLTLTGSLSISGNVNVVGANTLSIVDNFIYLNSNNTTDNEDVGIVANYNDGTYRHAGIFRDASDGYWKVFDSYLPEPDANVNIDTTNTSFQLANFQAKSLALGNTSTNWFTANATVVNATAYYVGSTLVANATGPYGKAESALNVNSALTANSSTYLGAIDANGFVRTSSNSTVNSITTFSGNVIFAGAVLANNSTGSTGQVLTTNGSAVYWAGASGGFTNGQSISVNNFVVTGAFTANGSNGTSGQILTSNGSAVYWSTANGTITGTSQSFTSSGSSTITLSASINPADAVVTLNGLTLIPTTDYTISGTTLTFTTTPLSGDSIEVRTFSGTTLGGTSTAGEVISSFLLMGA